MQRWIICFTPIAWLQEAVADRQALLDMAAVGTERFEMNKAPFQVESEPVHVGLGFYIE